MLNEYPPILMDDYPWYFGLKYDSYTDLDSVVKDDSFRKTLDNIVFDFPQIKVELMYDFQTFPLIYKKEIYLLTADNNKNFTAQELIFKMSQSTLDKVKDTDHIFFEGLEYIGSENNIPIYNIGLGS